MSVKSAAQLKAEREALNLAIRKAERAERRAAEKALLDAKHALGIWLAEAVKADTVESVEAIRGGIDIDQLRAQVQAATATETERGEEEPDVEVVGENSYVQHGEPDEVMDESSSPPSPEFAARAW